MSCGASSWHQTGKISNLALQHPPDRPQVSLGSLKVNCSCLDKILKSCLWESQPLFYNRSSWQRNQEVILSQDPRQVIVFPKFILISDRNGHSSLWEPSPTYIYKPFVFALPLERPKSPEMDYRTSLPPLRCMSTAGHNLGPFTFLNNSYEPFSFLEFYGAFPSSGGPRPSGRSSPEDENWRNPLLGAFVSKAAWTMTSWQFMPQPSAFMPPPHLLSIYLEHACLGGVTQN